MKTVIPSNSFGPWVFIVDLNFNAPVSRLMVFDATRFMYGTYFVKYEFKR